MATILAVEDEGMSMIILTKMLEKASHRVVPAHTNQEARQRLEDEVLFDLLVLDLRLGEEEGWKLLEKIRQDPVFANIPVLVYSGITDRETVIKVLDLGVMNYLVKPYNPSQLYVEVERALKLDWLNSFFAEPAAAGQRLNLAGGPSMEKMRETAARLADALSKRIPQEEMDAPGLENRLKVIQALRAGLPDIGFPLLPEILNRMEKALAAANPTKVAEAIAHLKRVRKILQHRLDTAAAVTANDSSS